MIDVEALAEYRNERESGGFARNHSPSEVDTLKTENYTLRLQLTEANRKVRVLREAVELAKDSARHYRLPFLLGNMTKALAETQEAGK